ncbi:tryptophan synthase beta subunit-like PLP-dependent enzyme [Hypoxylon trugodes]|uniref:tryptophan synthase beta subunit-like PLP-dependent enzyme n=1 Tax=Hypoxylon trugodes TaxID=326681 RepID=UPI00218EA82D|nr:tryptophan synthase beta subunit-like PLP-dependent enzyme [Hypoxylon trugodes]KAI1387988.1 tryptophan synthase beta subunit-like PLP-dependent enzyme [Hypoxylon trugodes]
MADINTCPPLTRASVQDAAHRISGHVHRTPVLSSKYIDSVASTPQSPESLKGTEWEGQEPAKPRLCLLFKCENFQRIGAFKPRGAFNALLRFTEEQARKNTASELPVRIISHSSGNHAQAVALAAGELGLPAHIVMPSISTPAKIAATRSYGAEVHFSGPTPQERLKVVDALMSDTNFHNVFVPPYDHPDTILGQGTLGLELQNQAAEILPEGEALHAIMTPCGGGGMLSGVALSCQGTGVKVFGSEPSQDGADDCRRGLLEGKRIEKVSSLTIADGLRTPVGAIPWSVISDPKHVAGVFAVTDDQIRRALGLVLQRMKILIEPSSAVPLAVALYNEDFRGMIEREQGIDTTFNLGLVVSGGNIDLKRIPELIEL